MSRPARPGAARAAVPTLLWQPNARPDATQPKMMAGRPAQPPHPHPTASARNPPCDPRVRKPVPPALAARHVAPQRCAGAGVCGAGSGAGGGGRGQRAHLGRHAAAQRALPEVGVLGVLRAGRGGAGSRGMYVSLLADLSEPHWSSPTAAAGRSAGRRAAEASRRWVVVVVVVGCGQGGGGEGRARDGAQCTLHSWLCTRGGRPDAMLSSSNNMPP